MSLKRNHWTNEEVIKIIRGLKLVGGNKKSTTRRRSKDWNIGIEMAANYFETHFACESDDFSALSYETDTGEIFHTGTMPPR